MQLFLALGLLTVSTTSLSVTTSWTCVPNPTAASTPPLPTGATFLQLVCSSPSIPIFGKAGPLNVSVLSADLTLPTLRLSPIADAALKPVDEQAASYPSRTFLGGINGGYFWRTDSSSFIDGVCLGKSRADAQQPPSLATPNTGVGDNAVVANGTLLSSNCDCAGNSRPAVLTINASHSRIDVLHRGDPPLFGLAFDAIGSGPNLVSTNASGTFLDIPSDDDNFSNILEHSANTAVGLYANGTAILVTTDGYDGCPLLNPTCGTNAFTLGYLMKDYFGVQSAMGMDQGGSTTMFVKGLGVVTNPGRGTRNIFSALMVEEVGV